MALNAAVVLLGVAVAAAPPRGVGSSGVTSGLLQEIHTNGALINNAGSTTKIVSHAALTLPADGGAARAMSGSLVGTFVPGQGVTGTHFVCRSHGGRLTVWVDDRLVCSNTPCEPAGRCDVGGGPDAAVNGTWPRWDPIPLRGPGANHTVRVHFIRDAAAAGPSSGTGTSAAASFELLWAGQWDPGKATATNRSAPTFVAIPTALLRPWSTEAEQNRTAVQASAASGWGPWFRNDMLTSVHLPDLFGISTTLVQLSTRRREGGVPINTSFYGAIPRCPCYAGGPVPNHTGAGSWYDGKGSDPTTCDSAIDMLPPWAESQPTVRPGAIAWDKSYSQVFVAWKGLNVSFETALVPTIDPPADRSDRAHDLVISISIVSMSSPPSAVNASDFGIGIAARFLFSHPGEVHLQHSSDQPLRVVGAPTGLEPHAFTLLSGEPLSPSALGLNGSFLAVIELPKAPGASGSIVISSSPTLATAAAGRQAVAASRARELARYPAWGVLAEAKEQIQTVLAWNAIYVPYERGVIFPVTRRCDKGYGYALFNWDSMFAAWMLGLETDSLALGLSHFVQAVQGRTERGFFASFFTGKIATRDKGQPPIASRAALELYRRHGDQVRWALELLWPTLCSNNDFFWDTRRDPTTDLVRLGSDPGFAGRCAGRCLAQDLQHARYESGLDNSATLDGTDGQADSAAAWYDYGPLTFNATTHRTGFYDVGNTAMHAFDSAALAELAVILGKPTEAAKFKDRHARVALAIQRKLWDNTTSSFVQLITDGPAAGRFYRRWSMTSLYPLAARAATDAQAIALVTQYLVNQTRFCVQPLPPDVSEVNVSGLCTFGSTSIAADDPAFREQMYVRGRSWAPQAMIVFLGLAEYEHLAVVRQAKGWLGEQMRLIAQRPWRRFRHVNENSSPTTGEGCDGSQQSDPFYTWGALNPFAAILQAGHWQSGPHQA